MQKTQQIIFFFLLILLAFVLNYFVFMPFLGFMFLAIVLAVSFAPVHKKIVQSFGGYVSLASVVSVLAVALLVMAPIAFFGVLLFQEAKELNASLSREGGVFLNTGIVSLEENVNRLIPFYDIEFREYFSFFDIERAMKASIGWVVENLNVFFTSATKIVIGTFLTVLALFYIFRDGQRFLEGMVSLVPMDPENTHKILRKLEKAISSVVLGRLAVALIQGIITGVGLFLFGVPGAVFWGALAIIFSLLPFIGPMFIILPAAAFLIFIGNVFSGIGLTVWGVASILLIDEYLGSLLIDRGMKIHPFLVLLSVLGGLFFFGPVGFVAGPVALSFLFALLDVYPSIVKSTV